MNVEGKKIVVWFSCGAASAVALQETIRVYGSQNEVVAVNTPVVEEGPDNRRFLADVESWLGVGIELAVSSQYPSGSAEEVWRTEGYMAGRFYAPCTALIKKAARQEWESCNACDWMVLGFTSDELPRHERFVLTERENLLPVLIDLKIDKQECYRRIRAAGIELPEAYRLGFGNANCQGCVRATSPTYWNLVRREYPVVFNRRAEMSRSMGVRLVRHRGKRLFLDELPPSARGYGLRGVPESCSVFCSEDESLAV